MGSELEVRVGIHSDQGGDVPWVAFASRDRSMTAVLRYNVAQRSAEFAINRPVSEDPCVLDYALPAWTQRAHLLKLMRDPKFLGALEAIRLEVPVSDAPAVFDALDTLSHLTLSVKDLPHVGDVMMVAERQEPALPLGYVGRVRLLDISPYNALAWIEKLDPRSEIDGFERALINLSDLKPVKTLKAPKPSGPKPPVVAELDPIQREPHTGDLFART